MLLVTLLQPTVQLSNEAEAWRNATVDTLRRSKPRPWGLLVALYMVSLLILAYPQMTVFFADALTPDSEWAYENTNIYALQDEYALTGEGVRVCIVDTGFESEHPAKGCKPGRVS